MGGLLSSATSSDSTTLQRVASVKLAMPKRRSSRKPPAADEPESSLPPPPVPTKSSNRGTALAVAMHEEEEEAPPPHSAAPTRQSTDSTWSSPRHFEPAPAAAADQPAAQQDDDDEPPPRKRSFLHLSAPAAAPPAKPAEPEHVPGGYLVFNPVSDGSLIMHFSETPVEGAIVAFRPKKTIPLFKFRQNGGRVEIIRKLQSNKQAYYEGVSQFIKTAASEFDSDVLLVGDQTLVYWLEGTAIHQLVRGTWTDTRAWTCTCSLPPGNVSFRGVKTIPRDQFVSISNRAGNGKAIILR